MNITRQPNRITQDEPMIKVRSAASQDARHGQLTSRFAKRLIVPAIQLALTTN